MTGIEPHSVGTQWANGPLSKVLRNPLIPR